MNFRLPICLLSALTITSSMRAQAPQPKAVPLIVGMWKLNREKSNSRLLLPIRLILIDPPIPHEDAILTCAADLTRRFDCDGDYNFSLQEKGPVFDVTQRHE
jgi:hypothetical protein